MAVAIIDSPGDRRNQWDKAIASAKEELEESKNALQSALDAKGMSEIEVENRHWTGVFTDQYLNKAAAAGVGDSAWAMDVVTRTQNGEGCTGPQASFGPELDPDNLPPQSLWASDKIRRKALDRRWTPKKMRMSDASVVSLVSRFMLAAELHSQSPAALESLPEAIRPFACLKKEELKSAIEEALVIIEDIRGSYFWHEGDNLSTLVPYPYYQHDPHGTFRAIGRSRDDSIYSLFEEHFASPQELPLPSLLASVSHNLLTSTAAPDCRTYNILLTGLSRLKADSLFDNAVESLYVTKVRPNETTCATILTNYTRRGLSDKFFDFVGRMRGTHSGGLMLARPDIDIDEVNETRLRIHPRRPEKIIQKVHPTPKVFSALVGGLLKFEGFERALQTCANMKGDGWGLDEKGWTHFLRDCVGRKNWSAGLGIWDVMQTLGARGRKSLDQRSYATMLALCAVCGEQDVFKNVFGDAIAAGWRQKELLATASGIRRGIEEEVEAAKREEEQRRAQIPTSFTLSPKAPTEETFVFEAVDSEDAPAAAETLMEGTAVEPPETAPESAPQAASLWQRSVVQSDDGFTLAYEELGDYQEDFAEEASLASRADNLSTSNSAMTAPVIENTIAECQAEPSLSAATSDPRNQSTAAPAMNSESRDEDGQPSELRTGAALDATPRTRYVPWRPLYVRPRTRHVSGDAERAQRATATGQMY
ncbi:hypothetical protein H2199_001866 [Coniosporium tulheliwenetii]|uniref:Uncharacterized protein n=1 Tax=Coniosporium tulheliwenetii TaxID=3383036 RepID=A0ACC2ZL57_9PEZI|nr:hypothetical protein H2199_001866 [Cladosporium sp. JES 115]